MMGTVSIQEREEPDLRAGERDMLVGWLEYHRATLAMKCAGLSAEQLRLRSVPPSALSLLGLVRHMADVERGWFRTVMAGEPIGDRYPEETDFEVDGASPEEAFAAWHEEIGLARGIVEATPSLDATGTSSRDEVFSLRWVLSHMVEEYARHNGHADLLRERIDGATGD